MKSRKSDDYLDEGRAKAPSEKKQVIRYAPYWRLPDGSAFEAIHVAGAPMFLCFDGSKLSVHPEVANYSDEATEEIIRPVTDFPYEPYNFTFKEIDALSPKLTPDAMEKAFETILNTITPYQDTEPWHLEVDSAGILLSYLQDKVESVPYIAKVGAAESGKTRSLGLVSWLAYRPMMAVDITSANVYRYYGQDVQAAGVVIHDEIDDGEIDKDKSLLAIYNAGYKYGAKVPRITGEHQDRQSYYNCYGIKWFGGTDLPYSKTFRSRCVVQHYLQGLPERIDITDEDKELFRKVRKGLLVLRLLKSAERLQQVNTGLTGRSRELYTPLLAPLQGTKWYDVLLTPLQELDRVRHEEDRESKQAYVAKAAIGCWLAAAQEKYALPEGVEPDNQAADSVTEALFVSNDSVIANLGLTETTNDKGRKILVSEDLPFTLSRWEIGKIQSENLKGKGTIKKIDGKVQRGHLFTLQTIRSLFRRYAVTLDVKSNTSNASPEGSGGQTDQNSRSDLDVNGLKMVVEAAVPSVTSVTSVTDGKVKCPLGPSVYDTRDEVIRHGVKSHPRKAITALLEGSA